MFFCPVALFDQTNCTTYITALKFLTCIGNQQTANASTTTQTIRVTLLFPFLFSTAKYVFIGKSRAKKEEMRTLIFQYFENNIIVSKKKLARKINQSLLLLSMVIWCDSIQFMCHINSPEWWQRNVYTTTRVFSIEMTQKEEKSHLRA